MTSEITLIISEEVSRYNRKTNEVRVDYKFEETKKSKAIPAGGQIFEIQDTSPERVPLPKRVKESLLNLPDLNYEDFCCSSLSFTLKNFFPM